MQKFDLKQITENKPLFYTIICCVSIAAIMFIIMIATLASVNNSSSNNPQKQLKASEKIIKNDPVTLFTTENTGKAIEVQALLAREQIVASRIDTGSKTSVILKEYTQDQRDRALLAIVKSGLLDEHTGLEIFDKGDFTSTKDDKKIRLVRAINGELARLIRKIPPIENAQVFVSIPEQTFFSRDQKPITATVQITMPSGERLDNMKVKAISNLLLGGIASLVLGDSASVSQAELVGIELPSRMINVMQTEKHFSNGSMNWMDATEFGVSSALATICKSSPFAEVTEWVVKEGGELTERVLFLSYLTEHFSNYVEQAEQESALLYEQEYLLCGDIKDSSNLYEVVGRVLLVREIFNLIHVISDGEKSGLAGEVALGLLGATGLPILVSVMKFLILFVWATEAALVETAALLQGKKVAVIPTGSSFPVSFSFFYSFFTATKYLRLAVL